MSALDVPPPSQPEPPSSALVSSASPAMRAASARIEGTLATCAALGLGVGLALVVDLSGPPSASARLATTAPSAAAATDLASKMEAQIAAGAPGVALAIEASAPCDAKSAPSVRAAHAHAQVELGDAPAALKTAHTALRMCEVLHDCATGDVLVLQRLDRLLGALVDAGVVDPKRDVEKTRAVVVQLEHSGALVTTKP